MGFWRTYQTLNRWTITYFHIRWIMGAIGALGLLAWLALGGVPEHTGTSQAEATLLSIEGDRGARYGQVELDSGNVVRVYLHEPAPRPGTRLPILIDQYDDGSAHYQVNGELWMDRL